MIIGISGKKNAGKDGVADYIIDEMFLKKHILFEKVKFADKLKDIVCLLLNCTRGDIEDREFKEKELGEEWWVIKLPSSEIIPYLGDYPSFYKKYDVIKLTPRLLLQLLGTECGRKIIHPDIWVNATMAKYKPIEAYYPGDYLGECDNCGKGYLGAKRSFRCEECSPFLPNWIMSDVRFPNEAETIKDKGGILIRIDRPEFSDTGKHLSEVALDEYRKFDYTILNNGTIEDLYEKIDKVLMTIEDYKLWIKKM